MTNFLFCRNFRTNLIFITITMEKRELISNLHVALLLQSKGVSVELNTISPVVLYEYNRIRKCRVKQIFCWKAKNQNNSYLYIRMSTGEEFPRWDGKNKDLEETLMREGKYLQLNDDLFLFAQDDEDFVRFERLSEPVPLSEIKVYKEYWG